MDEQRRQDIALFRISVLGPLVGAELAHGELVELCRAAAERRWLCPDGKQRRIEPRTIENWYYAYKNGGFARLLPRNRKDLGTSDIRAELADLLLRAKQEKPRRSVVRLIRMMVRAGKASPRELSRSSVHRLLQRHGASGRPERGPSAERRSFLYEFPGELLIGDVLHVHRKVLDASGRQRKAYMLSQIDCATRYVPESFFAFTEDAAEQEKGLKRVVRAHGLWRAYYVDHGAAYVARSLKIICAGLGMRLLHAGRGDAAAKGAIERWHRTWREEVEDELPEEPIFIGELEQKHRAWLACDYHARKHDTTGRAPKEHWLELCEALRALPRDIDLDELFLHRAERKVNNTGTVRWNGRRYEVSPELTGQKVELRFDPSAPEQPPRVFVNERFVCDTVPLDLLRNARRKRRRDLGEPEPAVVPTGISPLDDLVRDHCALTERLSHLANKESADEDTTED
jgi:putative transposase